MPTALTIRALRPREREEAVAHLARAPRRNLLLIDAVRRVGASAAPGEGRAEVLAARRNGELVALASLQPVLAVSAEAEAEAIEALLPYAAAVRAGLVKCGEAVAERIWKQLHERGRRAVLDRFETGFAVHPDRARLCEAEAGARVRPARAGDHEALVEAARASLREESRPDPFEGDAAGFRRWVAGRVGRALVLEVEGAPRFVGYADVQSPQGWLLQGVYTWPDWRRRGLAAAGVSALCRRAFEAGAGHVQLAVIEGNAAAEGLYLELGFESFVRLRTILFT